MESSGDPSDSDHSPSISGNGSGQWDRLEYRKSTVETDSDDEEA